MLTSIMTGHFLELAALFVIVLVHELGHVAAASAYGWKITAVKLLPFGGVAETDDGGHAPVRQEAAVAIAGPLQNGWMALASWCLGEWGVMDPEWSRYLIEANAMIGLFNLLPILPLDGGRLLQALCGLVLPYRRTLEWGAWISICFSGVMIIAALYPLATGQQLQLNLLAIGLFLLLSNWTYYRNAHYVFLRFLMRRGEYTAKHLAAGSAARPIVCQDSMDAAAIMRMLMRERYHLIYIMSKRGEQLRIIPEERAIERYLLYGKPGSAVSELFR